MGKFVGIDLGTTFSVVAYIDKEGNPQIIPNAEGDNITPSVVLFDGDDVAVGKEAKKESIMEKENYAAFVKRHMGDQNFHFRNEAGAVYGAEAISAIILKKLKQDAEAYLDDVIDGAVITVPAFFNDAQRHATRQAAEIAEIPVLSIINEPTAAALSYGIGKGDERPMTVAIYDLGGGTFDVSVMHFEGSTIETLASTGNRELGGYDFDNVIVDYVKQVAKSQGISIDADQDACQELQIQAEEAKKTLSVKSKAKISLSVNGQKFKTVIEREDFENSIEKFIMMTLNLFEGTVEEAGIEYSDLDKILLVGGSTRIPKIKEELEEETGIIPSNDIHPDEAVAIGAAYHALECAKKTAEEQKSSTSGGKSRAGEYSETSTVNTPIDTTQLPEIGREVHFKDCTAHGIGIIIRDEETGIDVNSVIMEKNTEVPAECISHYQTIVDYQEEIRLRITQGEETDINYVTIIGETILKLRPKPKYAPVGVVISCDRDSLIHVRVIDEEENIDLGEMYIDRVANLNHEEVKQVRDQIRKLNIGDE